MKRIRKLVLIVSIAVVFLVAGACALFFRPVTDGRTKEERQRIADALLTMLHSPLTNEVEIKADNPAVPEVIRALHPIDIELMGRDAVIICAGKPAEYHLTGSANDSKTWILYVAGPGYTGHREILRMKHD